jgi:opacity protein-like surface antigen
MKKRSSILIICLSLILILPGLSKAEKFAVKLSGGMNYLLIGDVNEGVKGVIDYFRDLSTLYGNSVEGEAKPIHLGFDFEGDIIINLTPRVGIGFGIGYIQGAKTSELTVHFPEGPEASSAFKPKISAIPIRVGVFYTLPVSEMVNVVFNAGAGMYLAKYSYNFRPGPGWSGNSITQTTSAKGFGFHGGVGLEFNLAPNIAFVLEGQGRYAKIGGFEGTAKYDGSSLPYTKEGALYYWEQMTIIGKYPRVLVKENKPSGPDVSNVRDAKVDFTGFTFLAGIKINF